MRTTHIDESDKMKGDVHLNHHSLYDRDFSHDSCGVGFIVNKSGKQTHDLMLKGHEALCVIPHRGGMSSEGVGDGAGINMDISVKFFSKILGRDNLKKGEFGVANFFFPLDCSQKNRIRSIIEKKCSENNLISTYWRIVETNPDVLSPLALSKQQEIHQLIFERPKPSKGNFEDFEKSINNALSEIEADTFSDSKMEGFYPLSMSARTMVYKGRLNSGEVVPFFKDLTDPDHEISIFLFHTRFSTNTAPATFMAQPFRWMAHNGELNTDNKNRLSEDAIAKQQNKQVIFPKGQSDSARLDQTLARRITEDDLDIVTAVVAMMPPAWENDKTLSPSVRAMYEYFSLYEEKNDGPAALVFSDGVRVGAKLDRMGLRPLRSVETEEYLAVTSEAGQIDFPPNEVISRGRIESGGILYYDLNKGKSYDTKAVNERIAKSQDFEKMLRKRSIHIDDLPEFPIQDLDETHEFSVEQRHVAYSMNQESFRLLLDPMIISAGEKISAMGYGVASNAMTFEEGGMSKYFSQRFAQVTNPPLDSIREKDGMTLRVALGSKPNFSDCDSRQIVLNSPLLHRHQLEQIRQQNQVTISEVKNLYSASSDSIENEANLEESITDLCDRVESIARNDPGIIIISDQNIGHELAPIPAMLTIAAVNQRLIGSGLRFNVSLIMETGQAASSHDIASLLGYGAHAVCPLTVHNRVMALNKGQNPEQGLLNFEKAIAKSLLKTMGKFGLCTAESYIGGEFFESNYLDTSDPRLTEHFPNLNSPVGGAGFAEIASSAAEWYFKALNIHQESDIPHLGLFKERQDNAGHTFGLVAVQEYKNMTSEELIYWADEEIDHVFKQHNLDEPRQKEALEAIRALLFEISSLTDDFEDIVERIQETFTYYGMNSHPKAMSQVQEILLKRIKKVKSEVTDKLFEVDQDEDTEQIKNALDQLVDDNYDIKNQAYKLFGFERRTPEQIDAFKLTDAYINFVKNLNIARAERPATIRDIVFFPADVRQAITVEDFNLALGKQNILGNAHLTVQGLKIEKLNTSEYHVILTFEPTKLRLANLQIHLRKRFPEIESECESDRVVIKRATQQVATYLEKISCAPEPIPLEDVQPAHQITPCLTTGAMSHGALVGIVHEAVSQGANIAGALSNSGEGGEKARRFNTVKSSSIKQIASGRFGVWAGYFADPNLKEIEIKIAQGAKPGEGGQLPAHKVNVEIASSRGGTPLVELVSPPPHHDTYSIEDLAQLIHDAHAARVKVVVKLVSSEGIGTIAVGVAKAGADVINVAGSTGGTGAAAVTSLKNTGRSAELGISEVHKALCENGIRDKVILRASNAHQIGSDVIKSAILGADSFEFGTTALMMLKCVMAKNCNIKCPAGLTTNPEAFEGDARALAQYFLNTAHDVRRILARLGFSSLQEIRGRTSILHLIDHPSIIGKLDFRDFLGETRELKIEKPQYIQADFRIDDAMLEGVKKQLLTGKQNQVVFEGPKFELENRNKSVGGQISIDIERILEHELTADQEANCSSILIGKKGRKFFAPESIILRSTKSAGQSYACWMNDGMLLEHTGTCNDGVGKGACGGIAAIKSPGGGKKERGHNVLIGNFALFGACGGQLYVNGEAGDRFAVRNSGALAVVEGVGDFCCEYMTSGTVLNLGSFGKGFCNGMSGGNAYQFDPDDTLRKLYSKDSVELKSIGDNTDEARTHESIIRIMLNEHIRRTDSEVAKKLLSDWENIKHLFKYAIPVALFKTQTIEGILDSMDEKTIMEELSFAIAHDELKPLVDSYKNGGALLGGEFPEHGQADTSEMYKLINCYSHMSRAVEMAQDQLKHLGTSVTRHDIDSLTRSLIVNHDYKLLDTIAKDAKKTLQNFTPEELASKLMRKRINDYKTSMIERDIQDNKSLGTTAWIIQQELMNSGVYEKQKFFESNYAGNIINNLM